MRPSPAGPFPVSHTKCRSVAVSCSGVIRSKGTIMSLKDISTLDDAQLSEREAELRKQLFILRTQATTEKVKDVSQFVKTKRDIARVLTLRQQGQSKAKELLRL